MNKNQLLIAIFIVLSSTLFAQSNGKIISDTNNLLVIKVWGSHEQRGYAQGELLGAKITDIFKNYAIPQFEDHYAEVKKLIASGSVFHYEKEYIIEAQALIKGMNSNSTNKLKLDYIDILLANSMLDIGSILLGQNRTHCSSLMSWGDATKGTDLDGKSVISRHLDWDLDPVLLRNQVMVIHIPSEIDEQPWAQIGFAGMISVLSGFNANLGVFQHMMEDEYSCGAIKKKYEPIWFTLRKSIEKKDPNKDGANNVLDLKYIINKQKRGFADAYIISALARSTEKQNNKIALVAELAPKSPYIIYRSNSFPDKIPGDNLYTANYQIARKNKMNITRRYNGIKNNIDNGRSISLTKNRDLMGRYSTLTINIQFMTYAPEMDLFRVSIYHKQAAYKSPFMDFTISELFAKVI